MFVRHPWFSYIGFEGEGSGAGEAGQGQAGQGGGGGGTATTTATGQGTPNTAGFTQEQVNSMIAARVADARSARDRELAEALGVPVEEAKRLIEAQRSADEATKTEAQKAKEAAERERAEAAKEKADAAQVKRQAQATLALAAAGVRSERFEAAAVVLLNGVPPDADDSVIKAAAEVMKTELPEFFGSGAPIPSPNPAGGPRAQAPRGGTLEAGRQRSRELAKVKSQSPEGVDPFAGLGRAVGT